MSFCTAVNCIDGRVQLPVIRYLKEQYDVAYVDVVTEPGPVRALAEPADSETKTSILRRVSVSISAHRSRLIAVAAHAECAGNPVGEEEQRRQLARAAEYLAENFPGVSVIGLWVDDSWSVTPACSLETASQDA